MTEFRPNMDITGFGVVVVWLAWGAFCFVLGWLLGLLL